MIHRTALLCTAASLALAAPALAERGADGQVGVIFHQAPSILNPYLSAGTKDVVAASLVLEPLARFDQTGTLVPWLAAAIPTRENGGIPADLRSITWTLAPGLLWSDGSALTAADVAFTWDYCSHPAGGCAQAARFQGITAVEALDELRVRISFAEPRPFPFVAFVGGQTPILQKAQFQHCLGARAQECTAQNFNPVGTGPFVVTEFRTNDLITLRANPNFRDPAKPRFAGMTFKGGGDAEGAARAVLETGEFDYAWNLLVPPDVLADMVAAGKGQLVSGFGTLVERIEVNLTDPSPRLPEGERSTLAHPHPILTDIRVRQALSMALDRVLLAEIGFGPAGRATCDIVPGPEHYAAGNTGCLVQDIAGANALLDAAGWTLGSDGLRYKDGQPLALLFQSSTNAIRQDFQVLIKDWWRQIGVATELKNVPGSVFFGGDPGSPDTFQKFYSDLLMYAIDFDGTDPESFLSVYVCDKIPGPASQWQGANVNRICDPGYEAKLAELSRTADPAKRRELAIWLNDFATVENFFVLPLVNRGRVSAHAGSLGGVVLNTWDSELWNVADWYRVK